MQEPRRSFGSPAQQLAGPLDALSQIARSVDALRSGVIVRIAGKKDRFAMLAVETADRIALERFETFPDAPLLLLTHARAKTLKIRLYTPEIAAIRIRLPINGERLRAIADPTADLAEPLKGPFETVRETLPASWSSALKLAKLAALLPALVVGPVRIAPTGSVEVSADTIENYDELVLASLAVVTRARLPLDGAERCEIVSFRAGTGEPEHLAILINEPPQDRPVLTRLHSECFTGDLLGSLRCDCGNQLRSAVEVIAESGSGIIIYLAQEGRGIGLINKLRAYKLQDQGFDTLEANERLGFEYDERLYGVAARMLTLLGFKSVRLLTNNPQKLDALEAAGVDVRERVPHAFPANIHNKDYLRTKAERSGHVL